MTHSNATKGGLKIVRDFKAPLSLVFDAFATAEAFGAWWGPAGSSIKVASFDFRQGGKVHYKLEGNGQTMWGLFKFGKIERPHLIEFVSSFSDEQGNICSSPFPMDFPLEIFNQVSLEEKNGITTLTIQGQPINATAGQEETYLSIMENMHQGFAGTFDQLDAYLSRVQS
jgi:uncharacterized protein YndB with AHSA1/START domain